MKKLKSGKSIFFDNTEAEQIVVPPMKLDNLLRDFEKRWEDLSLAIGSFAIFLTVLLALITADFKGKFGVPATTWQAVFIVIGILSLLAAIRFFVKFKKTPISDRKTLIKSLMDKKNKIN